MQFNVTSHISGAGWFITIPAGVPCKFTRFLNVEIGEEVIFRGTSEYGETLFDWGFNPRGVTTYRAYILKDNAYTQVSEWHADGQPRIAWNPLGDEYIQFAHDPRDALQVFLSARLAQKTAAGEISVRNENHAVHFPVTRNYLYNAPELPILMVQYVAGSGRTADISNTLNEELLKVNVEVLASTPEELDSVSRALRGLQGEIRAFLYQTGCESVEFHDFSEGVLTEVTPPVYQASLSYSMLCFSFNGTRPLLPDEGWKLLPAWPKAFPNSLSNPMVMTATGEHENLLQKLEKEEVVLSVKV